MLLRFQLMAFIIKTAQRHFLNSFISSKNVRESYLALKNLKVGGIAQQRIAKVNSIILYSYKKGT